MRSGNPMFLICKGGRTVLNMCRSGGAWFTTGVSLADCPPRHDETGQRDGIRRLKNSERRLYRRILISSTRKARALFIGKSSGESRGLREAEK
jgi:hypothetical protein